MKPQWFSVDTSQDDGGIPYDSMWADDRFVATNSLLRAQIKIERTQDTGSIFC